MRECQVIVTVNGASVRLMALVNIDDSEEPERVTGWLKRSFDDRDFAVVLADGIKIFEFAGGRSKYVLTIESDAYLRFVAVRRDKRSRPRSAT